MRESVERAGPSRLQIGFRRGRGRLRLDRAQIGLPAGVHQSPGRTQIFLRRHDGIFKKHGARLRNLRPGVSDCEIVAEIDGDLPISRLRGTDSGFTCRNPCTALSAQLDGLVDGKRRLRVRQTAEPAA